jgi:hypothetical protein
MPDLVPPWPADTDVPRWARSRRGRPRRARYEVIEQVVVDSSSARYHVALYKHWARAYVVVITEPDDVDQVGGDDLVKVRSHRRWRGAAGFNIVIASYLCFDDVLDLRVS